MEKKLTKRQQELLLDCYHIIDNQFSGGAKLMELMVTLFEYGYSSNEIADVENLIKQNPNYGLKVLNYLYKTLGREKAFIYTGR